MDHGGRHHRRRAFLPAALAGLSLWLAGCAVNTALDTDTHTVERGETLYSIAWHYGLDWRRLARWNDIDAPYTIYPGQRLNLSRPRTQPDSSTRDTDKPEDAPKSVASDTDRMPERQKDPEPETAAAKPDVSEASDVSETPETPERPETSPASAPESSADGEPASSDAERRAASGTQGWHWPASGRVVDNHGASDSRNGVDIGGEPGEPVWATKGGRVVYSGSGLKGYGKLVIIKHDAQYLSAYGYNRRLLVEEGEQVSAGDKIAEVGHGPHQKPMLHFEIRREGNSLDPVDILPAR